MRSFTTIVSLHMTKEEADDRNDNDSSIMNGDGGCVYSSLVTVTNDDHLFMITKVSITTLDLK